jgi:hypothetical protein
MVTSEAVTEHSAPPTASNAPAAKWAAVIGDRLVPLPRQRLKARDVLAQAGAPPDRLLVRDYNQPGDTAIAATAIVDLAEGNVFRIVEECDVTTTNVPPGSQPKLAFVADDAWEVTVQPSQTLESLRGLFDLPDDAMLFRDFESPNDQAITPGMAVYFADGPVFRIIITSITVKVNNQPVKFSTRLVTGLEIKQTAIAQGVAIDVGCVLYRLKAGGELGPAIDDHEKVALKQCDEFRCVAPDDNS